MASRDLVNNVGVVQLLPPQNGAASPLGTFTSKILNTAGFESVMIVVAVGTLTGVDASDYCTLTLQGSNSTTGFTAVPVTANSLAGTPSTAADFGDENQPFAGNITNVLPAPATMPTLYTGLGAINASTQANSIIRVGYIGPYQYLRVVGTFTGSPSAVNLSVEGVLGHAQYEPVTSPAAI